MNETAKQQKIARFLADKEMSGYVKDVLLGTFLKERKSTDVHVLAAERVAINLLQEGFRELDKFRHASQTKAAQSSQPGI